MKNEDTKILLAAKISFSISDMIVAILRITKIKIEKEIKIIAITFL